MSSGVETSLIMGLGEKAGDCSTPFCSAQNDKKEAAGKKLPFTDVHFPLYLAPMAGVTNKVFRQICKGFGADVLVTEFVSAEGVFRRNERTREYLDFDQIERPLGIQLFGGDAAHMAEAARQVVD